MAETRSEVREKKNLQDIQTKNPEKDKIKLKLSVILIGLVIAFFASLFIGRYGISVADGFKILLSSIFSNLAEGLDKETAIIIQLRLPRALLAMLVGASLSISGATLQGVFRNPLVSPSILGVVAGSAFGATLHIILFGITPTLPLFAFPFGMIAIMGAYTISRRGHSTNLTILILAGVVIGASFSALISILKFAADPYNVLPAITYWLMGSLTGTTYLHLKMVTIPILVGITILLLLRWRINILSLGEDEAKSLGVNTERLKWTLVVLTSFITAVSISVTGMIGWIGLVIPHFGRILIGPDHKDLLPASVIMGAIYLLLIDNIARAAISAEIPLGVLTALVGAPFFAFLLLRTKGGGWE